jgi:Calcineurin-like phosphoesterase
MLGDNIYADGTPDQYAARFERPYKALLDRGVVFQAILGNHDPPGEERYAPFNMNGHRYYSFKKNAGPPIPLAAQQVEFFALDTVTLDDAQLAWLRRQLQASTADWKIAFYHHPLYTSGRYRFAASLLRRRLEPIFAQYGVDVGFNGHEHFYERILPQRGVQYFTSGGGGALRRGDLRPSYVKAAGFDQDTHFVLVEIAGDRLYFQAISRTGQTVDQGQFEQVSHAAPPPALRQ